MATLSPAPINAPVVAEDKKLTTDMQRWIKALEAKIKELETRIAALEAP
jgi:hypothetical protein